MISRANPSATQSILESSNAWKCLASVSYNGRQGRKKRATRVDWSIFLLFSYQATHPGSGVDRAGGGASSVSREHRVSIVEVQPPNLQPHG